MINDDSGTISSVDADNNGLYDPEKDCLWALEAPEGKFVQVEFLTFDLENSSSCEMDFLQVKSHDVVVMLRHCRRQASSTRMRTCTLRKLVHALKYSDFFGFEIEKKNQLIIF